MIDDYSFDFCTEKLLDSGNSEITTTLERDVLKLITKLQLAMLLLKSGNKNGEARLTISHLLLTHQHPLQNANVQSQPPRPLVFIYNSNYFALILKNHSHRKCPQKCSLRISADNDATN